MVKEIGKIQTSKKNYGIDLLRLILMYMVCVLHALGQGGVLDLYQPETIGFKVFWLLKAFSCCAVNAFALISGYMAQNKPRKFEKLTEMWFQAFFYSFVVTMLFTIAGVNSVQGKADIIKWALPVTFSQFWYFTAFFALYFAIPLLNKFVFEVDQKTAQKAFLILLILFSGVNLLQDTFVTYFGYSTLWLMVLYCVGALAKRIGIFEKRKTPFLIFVWILCVLLSWCGKVYGGTRRLMDYTSPTIVLSGLIMVVLFSRMHFKGTIISKLSPLAFGIYLFQVNQVIWNQYLKDALLFVESLPLIVGIVCVFGFSAAIFVSGLIVEFIRSRIAKAIKIPELSQKIVSVANRILEKMFFVLE